MGLGGILGTVLGGGAGFLMGGPMGALAGAGVGGQLFGADEANSANAKMSSDQMAWQQAMSNSAHQREVNDLRAAGLNPILSVNAGASTPNGSVAQAQNVGQGLAASAMELAMMKGNLKKQGLENRLIEAQETKALADARNSSMQTEVMKKDLPKSEMINQGYRVIKPFLNKLENAVGDSAENRAKQQRSRENATKFQKGNP